MLFLEAGKGQVGESSGELPSRFILWPHFLGDPAWESSFLSTMRFRETL